MDHPTSSVAWICTPHIPWAQPTYRWHWESKWSMIFRFFQQSCLFCHFCPFWPHLCTPMGNPMAFFSFFSDWMLWVEYSFTHFKQEIGNFFIFFHYFFIIFTHFSKKRFFGPFSTFYAPPWTTPHPLWPEFVPPTSPEPNQPLDDIANQNNLWFLDFFSKVVFATFGHFGPIFALPWATPWHFF